MESVVFIAAEHLPEDRDVLHSEIEEGAVEGSAPGRLQSYVQVYHAVLALIALLVPAAMYQINEHVNQVVMQHDIARLQDENRDMKAALVTFQSMKTQMDFISDYYHRAQGDAQRKP